MPAAAPRLKPFSMCRLDLLNKQLPQFVQVCSIAAEYNTVWFTEETINHLDEVRWVNTGVGVPIGRPRKIKRTHQLVQTGERLPRRKSPMNRKPRIIHEFLAANSVILSGEGATAHCW